MPCEIMTADQVADLLQVSRDMVYQRAAYDELPGRKIGRIGRFVRDEVENYVRRGGSEAAQVSSATPLKLASENDGEK